MKKLITICAVVTIVLVVGGVAQALQIGPGSASGGSSSTIWSGLTLATGQTTGRIEINGIDSSLLTADVYGGIRLRVMQPGETVAENITLLVQSRTYPNSAKPTSNNPLFQSCEWGGGDGGDCTLWSTPSSHSHNPEEVIGPYDLALEFTQNLNGTWHINPLWRIPTSSALSHYWGYDPTVLPLDTWTTFGDGQWDTQTAFDLTSGKVMLDVGDGFTGGEVAYSSISTTLVPEPATIAILGLGGLSLIRRKRKA